MSGGLPKGWILTPVSQICEQIRGVSYNKDDVLFEPKEGYIPLLRANNINGGIIFKDLQYVPKENVSSKQLLQIGDVVLAMSSGSKKVVGKTAPINVSWNGTFGAFCGVLRPATSLNSQYFAFFFQTQEYRNKISELATGTNINNIKAVYFDKINFPLPPLNEQKRIVAKLDAIMPRIDSAKERLEKIPAILKRFRQSVLTAAVTGKLTEKWREAHPEAKEWDDFLLKDLIEFSVNGISKRKGTNGKAITVLRLADFDNGVRIYGKERKILLDEKEQEKYVLNKGDILIVRVNGSKSITGLFIVHNGINEAFCDHFIRLKVVEKMVIPDFILYRANFGPGRAFVESRLVTSAGQNTISQSSIFELPIPLPPLDEQKEIVRQVDKLFALADKVEEHYQKARARVDALSQSVLAKAFRGELVPQDPDDEPAEKLLQRIREEKGKMENRLKTASRSARGTRRNGAKTQQTSSKEKQASEP